MSVFVQTTQRLLHLADRKRNSQTGVSKSASQRRRRAMQLHRLKWQQNARTLCRHGNENAAALVACTCFCSAFDYVEILQKLKIL